MPSKTRMQHFPWRSPLDQNWRTKAMLYVVLIWAALWSWNASLAQMAATSESKARESIEQSVQQKVAPLLHQYCKEACKILDIKPTLEEILGETDELGFESLTQDTSMQTYQTTKLEVILEVDDRVSSASREHLGQILKNALKSIAPQLDLIWQPITVPQISKEGAIEDQLLHQLEEKIEAVLQKVIDQYCPDQCLITQVTAEGHKVTPDQALKLKPEEVLKDKMTSTLVQVDRLKIGVQIDSKIDGPTRKKIENLMVARTRFVSPIVWDTGTADFPEPYQSILDRKKAESADPFGLEKLRQTLTIFRELAGTKELITKSSEKTDSEERTSSEASSEKAKGNGFGLFEYLALGLLALFIGISAFVGLKLSHAGREAKLMLQHLPPADIQGNKPNSVHSEVDSSSLSAEDRKELKLRLQNEQLRSELIQLFFDSPKVARETFSRLIQEEGVELTAKYVHIFGQMIIFELLTDPSLQRDLHDLAEFYHKSTFVFSEEDTQKLLSSLKVRATANEMRVLSQKQTDKFDFLRSLDASQIYALLIEEKPQVQSIALTQLDQKRRRAVFELYTGQKKLDLMKELSRAETIPIEYLNNVAKALQKKIANRPEFDTANLKASDLLFDLLERAELNEQKELMRGLTESNPEAARAIKLKLVTVEMLPYLKDGHLLELILGIEREELLQFLAGTRDHIRQLIIAKAPEELADGWEEDLAQIGRLDDQAFRLVELKILGRTRQLASNGFINILDINELIFSDASEPNEKPEDFKNIIETKTAMVA